MHSQQIPTLEPVVTEEVASGTDPSQGHEIVVQDVEDTQTESISEHIPSKAEYSSGSEHEDQNKLFEVDTGHDKVSQNSSVNLPLLQSPGSDNQSTHDPSKVSASWPLDVNAASDIHLISEESPVNLALSSDLSKEIKSQVDSPKVCEHDVSPQESPKSNNYLDSLNQVSEKSDASLDVEQISNKSKSNEQSPNKSSSGSEEIIKLDIRGQAAPKFLQFPSAKIIFGPPPEGSTIIEPSTKPIPVFPNLLSPFLVGESETINIEEIYDDIPTKDIASPEKSLELDSPEKSTDFKNLNEEYSFEKSPDLSPKESLSDKIEEGDLLIEEVLVNDEMREKENVSESLPPKSMPVEETMSFSTLTTDYKTICEEYHAKVLTSTVLCMNAVSR